MTAAAATPANSSVAATTPAISFRETTYPPSRLGSASLLRLTHRRQRLHADAWRRQIVVRHEEIRHQGNRSIPPVMLEVAHAALIEHLVVDAELPGELTRGFCKDDMGGVAQDLRGAAGAHHGVAAKEITDRGGGDGGAWPQRIDGDAGRLQFAGETQHAHAHAEL